jgi:hypothetical protein
MTTDIKVLEWVSMVLKEPIVDVTTIAETPWSNILRINIGNEFVYLKHTPDLFLL